MENPNYSSDGARMINNNGEMPCTNFQLGNSI